MSSYTEPVPHGSMVTIIKLSSRKKKAGQQFGFQMQPDGQICLATPNCHVLFYRSWLVDFAVLQRCLPVRDEKQIAPVNGCITYSAYEVDIMSLKSEF